MKKTIYAIAAIALVLTGCTKEYNETFSTGDVFSIRAKVNETATKVSADNAGKFAWQADDVISVLNTVGTSFNLSTISGGTDAEFTTTAFEGTPSTRAYYPASTNHTNTAFYIEPEIAWKADEANMPMIGTVDTGADPKTVSFVTCGAAIKLVCYNVSADARKLVVSSDSKKLSGEFTPSGSPLAIATADKGPSDNTITITFGAGHPTNMVFYVPVPTDNLGKLTFVMKDDSDAEVSPAQTTKQAITMTRQHIVAAPALNCDGGDVLWSEDFGAYSKDGVPSGSVDKGFGGAYVTYACTDGGSTTKIYTEALAAGSSPELLVGKSTGYFQVSDIPTNGKATMALSFQENYDRITVSSSTDGVTITGGSFNSVSKQYTCTVNNSKNAAKIDLKFANTAGSNVRLDDILLTTPIADYTAPSITVAKENLEIEKAGGSDYTTFTYSNPVDAIPVSAIVEAGATSWLSASIAGTTLTVTATANAGTERSAKVTLRATGATKEITVTQESGIAAPDPIVLSYDLEGFPTSYGTANTFTEYTFGSYTYKIQQVYKNGDKMQWRASGNENGTGTIYNTTAMPAGITSIVIVFDASDSNKNHTVQIGASENPTSASTITPTKSGNTYTYAGDGTSTYFVITNGTKAGYITSITIKFK